MTAPLTTARLDEQPAAGADRRLATGPAPGPSASGQPGAGVAVVRTGRRRVGRRSGDAHLRAVPAAGVPEARVPQVGVPEARVPQAGVPEAGMATAEYAVALIAACAFAAVLLAAIRTNAVMSAIGRLITTALKVIS